VLSSAALQRLAARNRVRIELQERDYVLGWFLLGLAGTFDLHQALVFKGGTALRKMYFPTYRFSEDLDFTLLEPLGPGQLRSGVDAICGRVQSESGVEMWSAHWRQTRDVAGEEAYRVRVAYVGPLGRRGPEPPRITLDLTRYELLVLPATARPVSHLYPDGPQENRLVLTYRLEEMLAEKLRAMLRRCYPRDVYDVWFLLKNHDQELDPRQLLRALEAKCHYKHYTFSSAEDFLAPARRVGMAEAWDASLRHLVASPPAYERVLEELEELLPLWMERDRHGQ